MNRTDLMKRQMETEHYRYRTSAGSPPEGTIRVSGGQLVTNFAESSSLVFAREQFSRFLKDCLGLPIDSAGTAWHLSLDPKLGKPGFIAKITSESIEIRGRSERDMVDALHYLEREMVDRGGPWLRPGTLERFPTLTTRFSESIFIPSHQSAQHPGDFSPEYLGLMRHFGTNALKVGIDLEQVWKSTTLPELNSPNLDSSLEWLRSHTQHLADHGMDLFLILNMRAFPSSHPVFQKHPDIRGAREEIFMEELSGMDRCVLCSGHPKVLQAYREVVANLFTSLPLVAGGIMLIGGEGFHHCFMRPAHPDSSGTNCPHCREQDSHQNVATLVNSIAAGVQSVDPDKRLLAWPYSAFIWSKDDLTDSRWIRHLHPGVEVLSNIDCGDPDPTTSAGAYLFDYNAKIPGPSTRFAAQASACHEMGIPILAKTETNTTPDTFFLPYLPVHFRWYARNRAIRETGCSGFMGQWRFFGANGSLPEEIQYHAVWNPERTAEEILSTAARRDFGLPSTSAERLVSAWKKLSQAWDAFPYSAMTCGEREAYMRGPWYLGPAHPMIFDSQSGYQLGPKFFLRRGDLGEMLADKAIAELPGKPRYVCDLLLCLPFGIDAYLQYTRSCRDQWDAGLTEIESLLQGIESPTARRELHVCQTISIHLHTLLNTVEFLNERDLLGRQPFSSSDFQTTLEKMDRILEREIANARRALPILQSDPSIGYGHTYGEVYDQEMVEQKIAQCEFVREKELPRIGSVIRFHVWNQYP